MANNNRTTNEQYVAIHISALPLASYALFLFLHENQIKVGTEKGQMMCHVMMDLKDCLNVGSEKSAVDMAFMYSFVESCRANDISPTQYMSFLLEKLSDKTVDRTALLPSYCKS